MKDKSSTSGCGSCSAWRSSSRRRWKRKESVMELIAACRRYWVLGTKYWVLSTKYCIRHTALAFVMLSILASPVLADEAGKSPVPTHDLPTMLFVFMVASFIGLGVITRGSRLLHTP